MKKTKTQKQIETQEKSKKVEQIHYAKMQQEKAQEILERNAYVQFKRSLLKIKMKKYLFFLTRFSVLSLKKITTGSNI